jgi:hypothetical protein
MMLPAAVMPRPETAARERKFRRVVKEFKANEFMRVRSVSAAH